MDKSSRKQFNTVREYISSFPRDIQVTLRKLDQTIKKAAPKSIDRISYGMPTYQYEGLGYRKGWIVSFAVFKKHIGVFISPSFKHKPKEMQKYQVTKASHHFDLDKPFPFTIISKTVKALIKDIESKNSK